MEPERAVYLDVGGAVERLQRRADEQLLAFFARRDRGPQTGGGLSRDRRSGWARGLRPGNRPDRICVSPSRGRRIGTQPLPRGALLEPGPEPEQTVRSDRAVQASVPRRSL